MTTDDTRATPRTETDAVRSTIYERIGGADTVDGLVTEFYDRVLADPILEPKFRDADMDRLREMQRTFFAAALGGPVTYDARPLWEAHYGHGITREHFARFVHHLLETLHDFDVEHADRKAIIARINTYADEVIGKGHGASG